MKTHILVPIKEIKEKIRKLKENYHVASMSEGIQIMNEVDVLQNLLKMNKQLNLSKKVTQQAACDYAGDRKQGGEHGFPSWTASCIMKGYNQAIKDILL